MLYPGGSREQYRYDAVGNAVGYTTRAGQIRTSVFDNRVLGSVFVFIHISLANTELATILLLHGT